MKRSAAVIGMLAAALMAVTTPPAYADPSDYQYVRTESAEVRCVISAAEAACERSSADGFPDAPPNQFGGHWNVASVSVAVSGFPKAISAAAPMAKTWCWPTDRPIGSTSGPSCRPLMELG
jgi:hypothetical protein